MGGSYEAPRNRSDRTAYGLYVQDARSVNRRPRENVGSERDLVETHLFYVIQVAKEYRNLGIPLEDLLAEGNLGLIEAAARFDRTRGVKFISYATWWIRKRMWDLLARQTSLVRIPKYRLERLRRVRSAERRLRSLLGREPSIEEIAAECVIPRAEVDSLHSHAQREISLETIVNIDSGLRLEDVMVERTSRHPDSDLMKESREALLVKFLTHLPRRQREIISMHYGLGGGRLSTLAEIGRHFGVSRERVRQLEMQGLTRLRRLMQADDQPVSA